jgi:hypothetical protein
MHVETYLGSAIEGRPFLIANGRYAVRKNRFAEHAPHEPSIPLEWPTAMNSKTLPKVFLEPDQAIDLGSDGVANIDHIQVTL